MISLAHDTHSAIPTVPTIDCIPAEELPAEDWRAWATLQQQDSRVDSPFFRPEFTRLVQATRGNVEVAVLRRNDKPVGFLPFQRQGRHGGRPVGEPLNDFQGPILAANCEFSPFEVLTACGLKNFTFDHILADFAQFEASKYHDDESPYLDLSQGFDHYAAEVQANGSSIIKKSAQYSRKVERDIGPIRLVWRCEDDLVFNLLDEWKSLLYAHTAAPNIFRIDWIRDLLMKLRDYDSPEFSGLLTGLYAGDELLAVHLGMQSGNVLHWWLPTYNPEFSKHSPGTILLTEVAKRAGERGIERIDLGKGPETYKQRYCTGSTGLIEGVVDPYLMTRTLRSGWYLTRNTLRNSSWGAGPLKIFRKIRGWWSSESW